MPKADSRCEPGAEPANSFVDILRRRATRQPERIAYGIAGAHGVDGPALTYGALDRSARSLAVAILQQVSPGDRVLLPYPSGLDFLTAFCGCLYAGVVAVPLFPPRPNRTLSRLEMVLEDADARLALMPSVPAPTSPLDYGSRWSSLRYLAADSVEPALAEGWKEPSTQQSDLAYLQYTSGSTSAPRGVMVTHANLLYNCDYMREAFDLSADTVTVTWAPHFHDMGLIEGLLNPLYTGYPSMLMSPAQFIARPVRWLKAISHHRATHSGAPNFAYDLCVEKVTSDQLDELDLSSWTCAYTGAEPVRPDTLERFAARFARCGFRRESLSPGYGLAEATLLATVGARSEPPVLEQVEVAWLEKGLAPRGVGGDARSKTIVGCGHARRQTEVAIVDPETRRTCPERAVGEVWIAGPTVAAGYWNQPEATAATFRAFTADTGKGPFLRTGDLGFLADGELFITGRLKDLVIVRGSNVYLHDIDWIAGRAHPALRPGGGCALAIEENGEERLVVAHEVERAYQRADSGELQKMASAIRRVISEEFELQVHVVQLVRVGTIHKTSSGKIRRHVCRDDYLAGGFDVLFESRLERLQASEAREPPTLGVEELLRSSPRERRHALEEHLRRELGRVLGISWLQIDPRQPLGTYGLESIQSGELVARLEDLLGLGLPTTLVYSRPTVADISDFVSERMAERSGQSSSPERRRVEEARGDDETGIEILNEAGRLSVAEVQRVVAGRRSTNEDTR